MPGVEVLWRLHQLMALVVAVVALPLLVEMQVALPQALRDEAEETQEARGALAQLPAMQGRHDSLVLAAVAAATAAATVEMLWVAVELLAAVAALLEMVPGSGRLRLQTPAQAVEAE